VVHTHSTHRVALTLAGVWHEDDILPPLIAYERPGSLKADEQSDTGSDAPGGAG